jgi:hypothetical protein
MKSRKVLILFLSIMSVSIFFSLKAYNGWYNERVGSFLDEIYDQAYMTTIDQRKMVRWGISYESCRIIKDVIVKSNKVKDPLILTPPASYGFKFVRNLVIVEPVIFYYYTGLKTTTRDCKDIAKANYCILAGTSGQPLLVDIRDSNDLKNTLIEYKATPPQQ